MARPLRIEYPGAFYHVINRGLERREIFRDSKDREYFFFLLKHLHEKYGLWVHCYCLMSNHYHLYIETPNGQLSKIMRQLDGIYTLKFNKRRKRVGPLFQGRYKATLVDQDSYSLQLSKYIHLNPLKAKIVKQLEEYQFSSYPAYIGKAEMPVFLKTDFLLSQFHKSKRKAIKAFKEFMFESEEQDFRPEKEAYKGIILGNSDFVSKIQEDYLGNKTDPEIPSLKLVQRTKTLEGITAVITRLKLERKLEKKLIIYALKHYTYLSLKQIAEQFNGLHYSSISQTVKRLCVQAEKDKAIKRLIEKVDGLCKM